MTAACASNASTQGVVLHLAFELGWTHWKLAFTIGHGQKPRQRTIRARDLAGLELEIAKAKKRFKLAGDAQVVSCYEAGRDGFWLHRYLTAHGIANVVVDSATSEKMSVTLFLVTLFLVPAIVFGLPGLISHTSGLETSAQVEKGDTHLYDRERKQAKR